MTLKNYAPGAEVTLTLTLELRRSDGEADAPPVVQAVPVTVTIPKAEPEETQKDRSAAPEGGQAEVREDAVQEPEPALPAKESMDPVPEEPGRDGEEGDGA